MFMAILANRLLCKNGRFSTAGLETFKIFDSIFEIFMGNFRFDYKIWWHLQQDLCVFGAKNSFCNAKFSNFGELWEGGTHFWQIPRVLSHWLSRSVAGKMEGTTSPSGYILPICWEFPTKRN